MIEERIHQLIEAALDACHSKGIIASTKPWSFDVTPPKDPSHGDFSTNAALIIASKEKQKPRLIAETIVANLPKSSDLMAKVDIAGPGFINITLQPASYLHALANIFQHPETYGTVDRGHGKKVIIEFVSANPTGPLNIVSARAAAIGDTLANILKTAGFHVQREFYVNDIGHQIDLFALSLAARYQQTQGETATIPEDGYQGEYLIDVAQKLQKKKKYTVDDFRSFGLQAMIAWQKKSLKDFGVEFDRWFLQSELMGSKEFEKTLRFLEKKGYLYEHEGALFFKSTAFGDDKDRVVKKKDGEYTYFASDIAYHEGKFARPCDWAIDLLGPDHHGYVARTKAAVEALGHKPEQLTVLIVQQVNLIKEQAIVKMSKRAGRLVTMDDLIAEVGKDVARFFFLQRSASSHLDFDLELAKKETPENPVFYIQYAYARIASIFRKAGSLAPNCDPSTIDLSELSLPEELTLAKMLLRYPKVIDQCATDLEPHHLAFFLLELTKTFQVYYSKGRADERYRVLGSPPKRLQAKLYLLKNISIVLHHGLSLLGLSAPEEMKRNEDDDG
ncbi:MAG: arginine--tRNA ligase [Deltaproteobacteria bacterium]|nr:arginine--tRNA ligase [Deltaproteobacteria bacterium]